MSLVPADVRKIAEAYTQAWCSRSSEAVAGFFAANGKSIVNDGEPAVGRAAIAEAMQAFFADFPDLVLHLDDIRCGGNKAIFLWTLEGTNSGPGGTGNFVRISGWQNWRLSDDLLIIEADGGFDALDYDRQINGGS
jgi:uncharacterized protein (TIGR02246 family)